MIRYRISALFSLLWILSRASTAIGADPANCAPIGDAGTVIHDVGLLTNATDQTIRWNNETCTLQSSWYYFVANSATKFKARLTAQSPSSGKSQRVRVTQLTLITPAKDLKEGYQDWTIYEGREDEAAKKGVIGITIDSIKSAAKLRITQRLSGTYNSHGHDSATTGSGNEPGAGIAVTTPATDNFDSTSVRNIASLYIPEFLRQTVTDWHITSTSWDSNIIHLSPDYQGSDNRCTRDWKINSCPTDIIRNFQFMIRHPQSTPLTINIAGYETNGTTPVLLVSGIAVASAARNESMAIPLRHVAMVMCKYAYSNLAVPHNSTVGIYDKDLELQACSLVIPRKRNPGGEYLFGISKNDRAVDLLSVLNQSVLESYNVNALAFGVQRIQIKIIQDGEEISEDWWYYDPSGESNEWPLIIKNPKKVKDSGSVYEIRATVIEDPKAATDSGGGSSVYYRFSPTPPNDQNFYARLRPTGLFALPRTSRVRLFVTVPLDITAIRSPGSAIDLKSSSTNPTVQITPLRVGLLLGLEPWDYDRGKHLWPIPVRFLLGFHAVDLLNAYFSPSLLAGFSFTLPIIESPSQLNTSLALGAFYGFDVREHVGNASHFLLTLGFNFLSLFGAKAK